MSEKRQSINLNLIEKRRLSLQNEPTTSNLDEVFKNPGCFTYVSELKKSIYHIERLIPKEMSTPFKGTCVELSYSGRYLIFGSLEGRIVLVDINSREIIHEFIQEGGSIYTLGIYKNDKFIISAGKDGKIRKFSFSTFELVQLFEGHEKEVNVLVLSSDDAFIYSASDDGSVRVWDDQTGKFSVLYTHEKAVLSLTKSKEEDFLVSGGSDKQVIVYNLRLSAVHKVISEFTSGVWAVKISPGYKYLAAGDANGTIKVWNFGLWESSQSYIGHSKRISRLDFNSSESLLISSSNDTTVRVWNLDHDKNELILSGHTDWVKDFKLSSDEKYIFSIAENYKIICWYLPRFDQSRRVKGHSRPIHQAFFAKKNKIISDDYVFTSDLKEIKVWKLEEKQVYKTLTTSHEVSAICVLPEDSTLIAAYSNREICYWDTADGVAVPRLTHPSIVRTMLVSPDSRILAIGDANFRVTLYAIKQKNVEALAVFRRHTGTATVFAFSKPVDGECETMFSAGSDGMIFKYDLKHRESSKIGSHLASITALVVSRKSDLLISGDEIGTFKIWNIAKSQCIKTVEKHMDKITGIYFYESSKYFWISSVDGSLSLWNSTNFEEVTRLSTKYPISSFCVTTGETEILIAENDEIYFLPNILSGNSFFIYGPGREYYSFMKYLMAICEGHELPHDPEMDKWMIVPYEFNALHFYAYFNLPDHLRKAMANSSPFFSSKSGFSPVQIAIERNFRDCINEIIRSIRLNVSNDPFKVGFLEDEIIKLNELGFRGLDEFYESILYKSTDKILPKFVDIDVELPILNFSRAVNPQQKDFFHANKVTNDGQPIVFYQSALKVDAVMGSHNSIMFLESLVSSPNQNIFGTKFIRELVRHKWKYVKWVLLPQAYLYLTYVLVLSFYLIFYSGEKSDNTVSCIFLLSLALTFYEIFQLCLTKNLYFKDVWNYIDLARSISAFLYCFLYWAGFDEQVNKQVLVSVTFLSMVRGISYFRLFDDTRYLINLLVEVFKDMTSFLILLFYSTFSFALIYFIMVNSLLNSSDHQKPFSSYIATAYLLNLGDFNTENYAAFEWLIFFFASVINPLIMLNLLISIMGDTYGRVKEEQQIADMKEMTQMVIEAEYLMSCRRKDGKKSYLQICELEECVSKEKTLFQRTEKLKRRLKGIQTEFCEKVEENRGDLKISMSGISSKLDEMTTLVEQIHIHRDD